MSNRAKEVLPAKKARPISRVTVFNPAKGLNENAAPSLIDDREYSELKNIEFDDGGVARKRMGYTTLGNTLTAARGLGYLSNDSYNQIVTVDGTTLKYGTGTTWTTVSSPTFTTGKATNMTQARGKLYIWNGTDGGAVWDGSTLSRPGTMPSAKFSVYFKEANVAAGTSTKKNRLFISELADSSKFTHISTDTELNNSTEVPGATVFTSGTAANYIDIQPDDGDKITGLAVFQDYVIVFKQFAIYQMDLDANGDPTVVLITRSTGCISHKSIVPVENDLYFLSREGVRVLGNQANYFNSIRTSLISQPIQPTIDSITEAQYERCNGVYFNKQYILSLPTTTGVIDKTVVFHTEYRGWSIWTNTNSDSMLRYLNTSDEQSLLFLSTTGTQIYQFTPDIYTDNGVAIECYLLSKVFDFANPDITKYFADIGLLFRAVTGQINVQIYTDGTTLFGSEDVGLPGSNISDGMGIAMLGEAMLGTGGGTANDAGTVSDDVYRVIIKTKAKSIRFRLENNRNNEYFVLLGYIFGFYPYSHFLFDSSNKIYL